MKQVVVLRHGEKAGEGLSPDGIRACRELAGHIGAFSVVISSETERGRETARLLSGKPAVEDPRANIPVFPADASERLREAQSRNPLGIVGGIWESPELIACARIAGQQLMALVRETLLAQGTDERALIISHDGTMAAFEKLLMGEPFDTVDHSFGALQGVVVDENMRCQTFTP